MAYKKVNCSMFEHSMTVFIVSNKATSRCNRTKPASNQPKADWNKSDPTLVFRQIEHCTFYTRFACDFLYPPHRTNNLITILLYNLITITYYYGPPLLLLPLYSRGRLLKMSLQGLYGLQSCSPVKNMQQLFLLLQYAIVVS